MCYSALVKQSLKNLGFEFRVRVDYTLIEEMMKERSKGMSIGIPKAFESNFTNPETPEQARIKGLIDQYNEAKLREEQEELFAQKKRLADAERKMKEKPTKTAEKEIGVASRQIERLKARIEHRPELQATGQGYDVGALSL